MKKRSAKSTQTLMIMESKPLPVLDSKGGSFNVAACQTLDVPAAFVVAGALALKQN